MLLNRKIPISFFFQKIQVEFFIIIIYAIGLGLLDQYNFLGDIKIPLAIATILGTAISLLLTFRTSQAYERWWEARIVWGAIVNDSRTLIRQVEGFYTGENEDFIKNFTYRQIAWCYCLGEKLRNLSSKETLEKYFTPEEILELRKFNNLPNAFLNLHTQELKLAHKNQSINDFQQIQIDSTIARLCDSMGKSERIKTTIFPRTYSLLLHFLIYVFATILPFGLDHSVCFMHHPVLIETCIIVVITTIFMLIEKIAIHMQDPFENKPVDIPITAIARKIEIDLLQTIKSDKVPQIQETKLYYEM